MQNLKLYKSQNLIRIITSWLAIFIFDFCFLIFPCLAKDINFTLSTERNKVSLGSPFELYLSFEGTQDIPSMELPRMEGFQSRYLGPSTRMSVVNGQVSSSVTHSYNLAPLRVGAYKIGPFKFDYKGNSYISNSLNVEVIEAQVQADNQDASDNAASVDIHSRVFLIIQAAKNRVYLNEVIPLSIKLYVNKLTVRDIQYPVLNHEGFSLGAFEKPKQYEEVLGGIDYQVVEFNASIFGLKPGEFRLGPANLECNLLAKKQVRRRSASGFDDLFGSDILEDFFGQYQTYPLNLKSADIPLTVLALPEEGKTTDFNGSVGDFKMEASISPSEVKAGDPVTLRVGVRGRGNFNTVTIPKIEAGNNFKVYEPQVKQEARQKDFEQVIIPWDESVREIPALRFSFFNPDTEKYQTILKGPFPLKVLAPDKSEELKVIDSQSPRLLVPDEKEEKLGRDIVYIKPMAGKLSEQGEYLYKNKVFLWLQVFPFLSFLVIYILKLRSQRLKTDLRYARKLSAPKKARTGLNKARNYLSQGRNKEFYDTLFSSLREYLGDRFHLPSQSITIDIIDGVLKPKGASIETLNKLKDIFNDCDTARYSSLESSADDMNLALRKLEEVIDYFQKAKI
ncbi:MAG: BatD family protein [Candidatus Omnitrophota bacterium]|nr:BatD family protein [Candidatus Omnitrophota bacterium]